MVVNEAHHTNLYRDLQVITVKPVLSGPVLNGQLQKSRKFILIITLNVTSIKRSRSPFTKSQARVFLLFSPVLSGHFIKGNHTNVS